MIRLFFIIIWVLCSSQVYAQQVIFLPGAETEHDKRYEYQSLMFRISMEQTIDEFGPFTIKTSPNMTQSREERNLSLGIKLDVMFATPKSHYLGVFTPVLIPIRKGLLGYRIFLINEKNKDILSQVNSVEELKKFSVGQGKNWSSVDVLESAGFKVVRGPSYDGLFGMLVGGRFDLFSRSISEVEREMEEFGKIFPQLMIEETTVLYYLHPDYFWFSNSESGKKLRIRVEKGLKKMIKNGLFDKTFHQYHADILQQIDIENRKVYRIDNPFMLPEHTPPEEYLYSLQLD